MEVILSYLNEGPKNLTSFDYKDWDDDLTEKIMNVIRNSVPEQRVLNEILGSSASAPSRPAPQASRPAPSQPASQASNPSSDLYDEVSNTKVSGYENTAAASAPSTPSATNSLEDLYSDL
jgi:hypothetical protein